MPAVSVLMPCYNAGAMVDEALESLVCQTLTDIEIICVEDGSTDDTPLRLDRWATREARLRVVRQPHAGVIAAANTGLGYCRAPYVARLDADDRAHPERLARQAAYLDAHPEAGLVSCQVAGFPAAHVRQGFAIYLEWLNGLLSDEDMRREMFIESPLPNPSVTIPPPAAIERRRLSWILAGPKIMTCGCGCTWPGCALPSCRRCWWIGASIPPG